MHFPAKHLIDMQKGRVWWPLILLAETTREIFGRVFYGVTQSAPPAYRGTAGLALPNVVMLSLYD